MRDGVSREREKRLVGAMARAWRCWCMAAQGVVRDRAGGDGGRRVGDLCGVTGAVLIGEVYAWCTTLRRLTPCSYTLSVFHAPPIESLMLGAPGCVPLAGIRGTSGPDDEGLHLAAGSRCGARGDLRDGSRLTL